MPLWVRRDRNLESKRKYWKKRGKGRKREREREKRKHLPNAATYDDEKLMSQESKEMCFRMDLPPLHVPPAWLRLAWAKYVSSKSNDMQMRNQRWSIFPIICSLSFSLAFIPPSLYAAHTYLSHLSFEPESLEPREIRGNHVERPYKRSGPQLISCIHLHKICLPPRLRATIQFPSSSFRCQMHPEKGWCNRDWRDRPWGARQYMHWSQSRLMSLMSLLLQLWIFPPFIDTFYLNYIIESLGCHRPFVEVTFRNSC